MTFRDIIEGIHQKEPAVRGGALAGSDGLAVEEWSVAGGLDMAALCAEMVQFFKESARVAKEHGLGEIGPTARRPSELLARAGNLPRFKQGHAVSQAPVDRSPDVRLLGGRLDPAEGLESLHGFSPRALRHGLFRLEPGSRPGSVGREGRPLSRSLCAFRIVELLEDR